MPNDMQAQAEVIKKKYQELYNATHSPGFSSKKYRKALKDFYKAINRQTELIEIAE